MAKLPIPAGPEALTCEWLTDALREGGALDRASVNAFEWQPAGEEWGFTGRLARVTLRYDVDEQGAPPSVVAKFPNPAAAGATDLARLRRRYQRFEREVLFYQQIGQEAGIRTPALYYGSAYADAGEFVLLLEDLTGSRIGDAMEGCSLEEAKLVIEQAAALHARWWAEPKLLEYRWLPWWGEGAEDAEERLRRSLPIFFEKFGRWLPASVAELTGELAACYARLFAELSKPPWTLIHADLHLDNILLDVPDVPLAVLDWQGVSRGCAAIDLTDIVFQSLPVEERRTVDQELLHSYHAALQERGVAGYSYDELLYDSRLALLRRMGGVVNWYAAFDMESKVGREREMVRRFFEEGKLFAALMDHHAGELLTKLRG